MSKKNFSRLIAFVLVLATVLSLVSVAGATYRRLKLGDDNGYVKDMQKALKKQGYYSNGNIDGYFGAATLKAVKAFQTDNSLEVDGIAGNETLTVLYNGQTGLVRAGTQSDEVRKIQNALRKKGFYKGDIDGKLGPETTAAIRAFQKKYGLTVDGKAGNQTKTALFEGISAVNTDEDIQKEQELIDKKVPSNPRSLYYGCTGSRVTRLQRALKTLGFYKGKLDGKYGDLTYKAVKKYQWSKNMHADGIAGPETLKSINKHVSKSKQVPTSFTIDVGSQGSTVATLKSWLSDKGYNMDMSEESLFTQTDKDEVKTWQSDKGKTVTGTISESQYNKIILGQEE